MGYRSVQAFKRHRYSLPWLLLKKSLAGLVTIETLVLFDYDLQTWPKPIGRDPTGLAVCRVDDVTSPLFARLCAKYPDKDFPERGALPGRECYVAVCDDDIAGYAWVSADSLHVDEIACTLPLAPDEVFIYDCFVDEAHRGKGIYPLMLQAALRDCAAQRHIRRALIGAASVNHASLRGIRKAGFREWKRVHYVACGSMQRWWGLAPAATRASAI